MADETQSEFKKSIDKAFNKMITTTGNATSYGLYGTSVVASPLVKGASFTTENSEDSFMRMRFNDWNTAPFDKLPKKDRHPAIEFFADEITAEKDRLLTGATNKEYIDIVQKIHVRAMDAMGQINTKANQAEIPLVAMIMSAHRTGDLVDRSNKDIKILLGDFEKKIDSLMEVQRFSLELRPFGGVSNYSHLACFSPSMVADKLLEVVSANVQKKLTQVGVDASDLSINEIKKPNFTRTCYEYKPFEFGFKNEGDGLRGMR